MFNKNFIMNNIENGNIYLECLPIEFQKDKEIVLKFLEYNNIRLVTMLQPELRKDKEVVLKWIKTSSLKNTLSCYDDCIDQELFDDSEVMFALIREYCSFVSKSSIRLLNDRKFILDCVSVDPFTIKHVPSKWRDDKEIMIACVGKHPRLFQWASDRLKMDKDLQDAALVLLENMMFIVQKPQLPNGFIINDSVLTIDSRKTYGDIVIDPWKYNINQIIIKGNFSNYIFIRYSNLLKYVEIKKEPYNAEELKKSLKRIPNIEIKIGSDYHYVDNKEQPIQTKQPDGNQDKINDLERQLNELKASIA